MRLTDERLAQIGLTAFIAHLAEEGRIPNEESLKRSLPNEAKKLGITAEEAEAFIREILPKVIKRRLGSSCEDVRLSWV